MSSSQYGPWTSGGTGGVYDPVTTSDRVRINDPEDDHFVGFRYERKSAIKSVYDTIRSKSLRVPIFVAVALLVLLVIIIVVATHHNTTAVHHNTTAVQYNTTAVQSYEKWKNTTGLSFYPIGENNTVYIHFSLKDSSQLDRIVTDLNSVTSAYDLNNQQNELFVECNKTFAPADKVCSQVLHSFGDSCTKAHKYGYLVSTPCIMLILSLPNGVTIEPIKDSDLIYSQAKSALNGDVSSDHIGVSCKGATSEDEKHIGKDSPLGDPIAYFPKYGFPSYVFRNRTTDYFLNPAVMIQFRSIRDAEIVRIMCTAWGTARDQQGKIINQQMFTTTFVVHIY